MVARGRVVPARRASRQGNAKMPIRPSHLSCRKRPAPAKAHAGTARRTRAGTSRKPVGPPPRKLEKPENGDQDRPPRKNPEEPQSVGHTTQRRKKPEKRESGRQARRPREQEKPEFRENGGQPNGGQSAHPVLDLINSNLPKFIIPASSFRARLAVATSTRRRLACRA